MSSTSRPSRRASSSRSPTCPPALTPSAGRPAAPSAAAAPVPAGEARPSRPTAESLEQSIAALSDRLDTERRAPGGTGQEALDRDLEGHRSTARLRALRRFGLDLCLGRIVSTEDPEP